MDKLSDSYTLWESFYISFTFIASKMGTVETKKIMFAVLAAALLVTLASVSYIDSISAKGPPEPRGCSHEDNAGGATETGENTCGTGDDAADEAAEDEREQAEEDMEQAEKDSGE